jgi:hypothetical protein
MIIIKECEPVDTALNSQQAWHFSSNKQKSAIPKTRLNDKTEQGG